MQKKYFAIVRADGELRISMLFDSRKWAEKQMAKTLLDGGVGCRVVEVQLLLE